MAGYTLEQLLKMGAKPADAPAQMTPVPKRYTRLELAQMGIFPEGEPPPPKVGPGETFVNRATNALPLGRPAVDSLSALAMQGARAFIGRNGAELTPQARAQLEAMGETPAEQPGLMDDYRHLRDTRDVRTDAGSEQNPWAGRLGTGTGVALSILAPGPKGLGAAGRGAGAAATAARVALPRVMAQGALLGGLQAFGDSRADLTRGDGGEALQALGDTARGAGWGAAGGFAGYQAGRYAPTVLRAGGRLLKSLGIAQGRRALLNGADSLTKNVTSDAAVEEAISSGGILPFGTTKGAAQRLERSREALGTTYTQTVERLEDLGVQGADAHAVADHLLDAANDAYYATSANKAPVDILKNEAANVRELAQRNAGSQALPGGVPRRALRPRLGLRQTERIKQDLQRQVNYSPLVDKRNNDALMDAAALLRRSTEDAIDEAAQRAGPGSEIAELGETFRPVKRRLGLTIEASDAANRGAQKAANRSAFGLPEVLAATSTGEPLSGLAAALAMKGLRNRGPSTVASGGYWSGRGLEGLARLAAPRVASGALPWATAQTALAAERPLVDATMAMSPDDERRLRMQAWIDALRAEGR